MMPDGIAYIADSLDGVIHLTGLDFISVVLLLFATDQIHIYGLSHLGHSAFQHVRVESYRLALKDGTIILEKRA